MDSDRSTDAANLKTIRVEEDVYGQTSMEDWRRWAVNIFTATLAALHLPGLILWLSGLGPPRTGPAIALIATTYLIIIAAAVLRRLDYRIRAWAILIMGYLTALMGPFWAQAGPFLRILPVIMPIIALVLVGPRSGRLAAVLSVPTILFLPLSQEIPGFPRYFDAMRETTPESTTFLLTQDAALIAVMLGQIFMLDRFHQFLMRSLMAQRQAAAVMEHESAQRAEAHKELAREMGERRRLENEIARIGDEERRRLGQDIHDGVCQELTGALLRCRVLERRLEKDESLHLEDLKALSSLLETAIDEAHAVAKGLCPLEPDPEALARAVRKLARRTQETSSIQCEFVAVGNVRVSDQAKAQQLYRIAQEALSNAVQHSKANRIVVELREEGDRLTLQVLDDGIGLPEETPEGRLGLRMMTYRAQAIEGELTFESVEEGGTRLTCSAPLDRRQRQERCSEEASNMCSAPFDSRQRQGDRTSGSKEKEKIGC